MEDYHQKLKKNKIGLLISYHEHFLWPTLEMHWQSTLLKSHLQAFRVLIVSRTPCIFPLFGPSSFPCLSSKRYENLVTEHIYHILSSNFLSNPLLHSLSFSEDPQHFWPPCLWSPPPLPSPNKKYRACQVTLTEGLQKLPWAIVMNWSPLHTIWFDNLIFMWGL